MAWLRRLLSTDPDSPLPYDVLNAEAAAVPIGSEGVLVLDHFQGNRTPHTDMKARNHAS